MLGLGIKNLTKGNNEEEAVDIVRYAIDNGVNYIDTGYTSGEGEQEKRLKLLGKALREGYREKAKIAITVPSNLIITDPDFDEILESQLKHLEINSVDFCLLGGLNRYTWPRMVKKDVINKAEKAMTDGKFNSFGFFFHDYFQALREIIEEYDNWTMCGFQYSYMDVDHHPGYGGLRHAADKGLAVFTTEPHLGGRLVSRPPNIVNDLWREEYSEKLSVNMVAPCIFADTSWCAHHW